MIKAKVPCVMVLVQGLEMWGSGGETLHEELSTSSELRLECFPILGSKKWDGNFVCQASISIDR
jgi:hypothetical protein